MSGIAASHPGPASLDGARRYDAVARSFHWIVVALVVLQYLTKWLPKNPGCS